MALFILSSYAYPNGLNRDIIRFIYKYSNVVTNDELYSSVIKELQKDNPNLRSIDYFREITSTSHIDPRLFVYSIENQLSVSQQGIYEQKYTKKEWLAEVSKMKLYVLLTSSSAKHAESSFGHITLLYENEDNKYFSKVVAYLASSFQDSISGTSSISKYIDGLSGQLDGELGEYILFDEIYESVINDGRIISKYYVNIDSEKRKIVDANILDSINIVSKYSFLSNNCASHIFNLLFNNDYRIKILMPPSVLVNKYLNTGQLVYSGSYVPETNSRGRASYCYKASEYFDISKSMNYSSIGTTQDETGLTLLKICRPFNGISYRGIDIQLFKISINEIENNFELNQFDFVDLKLNREIIGSLGIKYALHVTTSEIENYFGVMYRLSPFMIEGYSSINNLDTFYVSLIYSNHNVDLESIFGFSNINNITTSLKISYNINANYAIITLLCNNEIRIGLSSSY